VFENVSKCFTFYNSVTVETSVKLSELYLTNCYNNAGDNSHRRRARNRSIVFAM